MYRNFVMPPFMRRQKERNMESGASPGESVTVMRRYRCSVCDARQGKCQPISQIHGHIQLFLPEPKTMP